MRRPRQALERLKRVAIENGNVFAELMKTVRICSLGQITKALFEVVTPQNARPALLKKLGIPSLDGQQLSELLIDVAAGSMTAG